MTSPYFVYENETLVSKVANEAPAPYAWHQVLGSSIHGRNWKDGPLVARTEQLKAATLADFDRFRVATPPNFA